MFCRWYRKFYILLMLEAWWRTFLYHRGCGILQRACEEILRLTWQQKIHLCGRNDLLFGGPGRPSPVVQLLPSRVASRPRSRRMVEGTRIQLFGVRLISERIHGHRGSSGPQLPPGPSLRHFSLFPGSFCLLVESITRGYFYSIRCYVITGESKEEEIKVLCSPSCLGIRIVPSERCSNWAVLVSQLFTKKNTVQLAEFVWWLYLLPLLI